MASLLPSISVVCVLIIYLSFLADGGGIGVNYGLLGNNLPPPSNVVNLLKSRNIGRVRIFSPDLNVLDALQNSGIQVIIGTFNQDIPSLAGDINFAKAWVQSKIVPYAQTIRFRCISIGNEVIPGDMTNSVFPAMQNMNAALKYFNLGGIPVSTAVPLNSLGASYPPSYGDFSGAVKPAMRDIAGFLAYNGFPLLVTAYPYFAYANEPGSISLPYVLFTSPDVVVRDGDLGYTNMFDAMVDAVYSALEKVGAGGVEVVICETGWPSQGNGDFTTPELARTYNQNLLNHVRASGTPKRPNKNVETYVFALFNENQKDPGVEQHFGLFYPDMTEVYHINF
ncbi:putative glucan endo-1,3-beta-glucosidase GVI [Lactuca sativa]|uniref:Glucan endo-1,3-beta-D-glucosidase n=1 Tax=Lactuca sativa TaxID=4236 RepID=A0A9R1X5M8_LACSA|nr:putative glucan endo-1,3-beta-glucosidase GVI [Lactuca sativa]KAJ0201670.1 hypothetical protein LSAT_V11C600299370 [Lactuca sativa]